MNRLWSLNILDRLDRLDRLDKLDRLDGLDRLDDMDKLDGLDIMDKIDRLDIVDRLDTLDRLDRMDGLDRLDTLDRLHILINWIDWQHWIQQTLNTPNCGVSWSQTTERNGGLCKIPPLKGARSVQTLRNQSFQVSGPRLFNSMPKT